MRQELELAKAEVKQEITKTGKAAGMFGAAGFAGDMVLLFASIAAWWGLANVMDQGWAALIVTAYLGHHRRRGVRRRAPPDQRREPEARADHRDGQGTARRTQGSEELR